MRRRAAGAVGRVRPDLRRSASRLQNSDIADETVAERQRFWIYPGPRAMPGWKMSAVEQAKSLLAMSPRSKCPLCRGSATWMSMPSRRWRGRGRRLIRTINRPTPDLDDALPLPANLPADLLGAPSRHIWRRRRGSTAAPRAARPRMPISIPTSIWRRCSVSSPSGFPIFSPATPSRWAWGRRSICRSSMPASIRAQYAGATADLDAAVADYNGAVVNAVKQTADAMTQVASLAAQRAHQQARWTAPAAPLRSGQGTLSQRAVRPDSHADRGSTLLQARQQMAALVAEAATSASRCCSRWAAASSLPTGSEIAKQDVTP